MNGLKNFQKTKNKLFSLSEYVNGLLATLILAMLILATLINVKRCIKRKPFFIVIMYNV